jgi:hypothetical protein
MQQSNGNPRISSRSLEKFKAEIEKSAKEIFLKRQKANVPGDALSDWLHAERKVKEKYCIS